MPEISLQSDEITYLFDREKIFDELKTNSIIMIAADKFTTHNGKKFVDLDNSEFLEIKVSNKSVSGEIQSIRANTVVINGKEYEASSSIIKRLSIRDTCTFYLNSD